MGGACVGARGVADPLIAPEGAAADPALKARLAPVLQAANKASSLRPAELSRAAAALKGSDPDEASEYLIGCLSRSAPKARSGLLLLLQRIVAGVVSTRVAEAEAALLARAKAAGGGDGEGGGDFPDLATACEDVLRVEDADRPSILTAVQVLAGAARAPRGGLEMNPGAYVVPDLDRLVLLFRRPLLAHVGSAARNLQRWREMETEIGLPALEHHLPLLGRKAKGLLLGLLLVPDGAPPAPIVVSRERPLQDARERLAELPCCVLSCYFESAAGTKVIEGKRVEGGEGHGPRKEFFIAASADALRRWGTAERLDLGEDDSGPVRVTLSGNRFSFQPPAKAEELLERLRSGSRVKLALATGAEVERVVTGKLGGSLLVDKPIEPRLEASGVEVLQCEVQEPRQPLFEFHRGTGQTWFSGYADLPASAGSDLRDRYRSFGKLLALALVNHCKLSFVLPIMFFRVLLRRKAQLELEDLKGFDGALHASLKKCLKMRQAQFAALKEVEGLPAALTREDYVAQQVAGTLSPAGMDEIRRGFESMAPPQVLRDVASSELRQMLCPTALEGGELNIRHLFEVVMEEEMSERAPFVEAFWQVVDGFSPEEKRRFLLFVTGVESPPEAGSEQLLIQLPFSAFTKEEHAAMLNMLPQAHTCTNTLELPNYHEALLESGRVSEDDGPAAMTAEIRRILGEKLRVAMNETAGYELDGLLDGEAAVAAAAAAAPGAGGRPGGGTPASLSGGASTPKPWEVAAPGPAAPNRGAPAGPPHPVGPTTAWEDPRPPQSGGVRPAPPAAEAAPPAAADTAPAAADADAPAGDEVTGLPSKLKAWGDVDAFLEELDGAINAPI